MEQQEQEPDVVPTGMRNLTPTESKLWEALADGAPHSTDELRRLASPNGDKARFTADNLTFAMYRLRLKVREANLGETVISECGAYRKVRYINAIASLAGERPVVEEPTAESQ